MKQYDKETERYLAEFRPRAIREFKVESQRGNVFWKRLTAGAAIAACVIGLVWTGRRGWTHWNEAGITRSPEVIIKNHIQDRSTIALTKLALDDTEQFEVILAEQARTSLVRFQQENSALKALAKE
jgi:hypothetical protein